MVPVGLALLVIGETVGDHHRLEDRHVGEIAIEVALIGGTYALQVHEVGERVVADHGIDDGFPFGHEIMREHIGHRTLVPVRGIHGIEEHGYGGETRRFQAPDKKIDMSQIVVDPIRTGYDYAHTRPSGIQR